MKTKSLSCIAVILLLISAPYSHAARTSVWQVSGIKSWLEGEFEGTGLTSNGRVIPTTNTSGVNLPSRMAWESAPYDDGVIVGTSLPATLTKVDRSQNKTKLLEIDDLGFTALTTIRNTVYAAATPSGRIYKYTPDDNSLTKVATLSDSYVWTMQPDSDNDGIYLGTGPHGTVYHLTLGGGIVEVTDVPGNNIMGMTYYNDTLYVGDDFAGVYKINDRDQIESVYGFESGEIAELASNKNYLYIGLNRRKGNEQSRQKKQEISKLARQLKEQTVKQNMKKRMKKRRLKSKQTDDSSKASNKSDIMLKAIQRKAQKATDLFAGLSGTVVYRMNPPNQMNIVYNDREEILHDLASNGKSLFVATGGKGRLYKVKSDFTRVAYFQSEHKLILDVTLKDGVPQHITTGEGGAVFFTKSFAESSPRYRSPAFDAQLLSKWGVLSNYGSGNFQFRTRSGNSPEPDTMWSHWSSWNSKESFDVASPNSRFIQFEVKFLDKESSVKEMNLAYQIPNQRPRIADISISPNPIKDKLIRTNANDNKNRHSKSGSSNGNHTPEAKSLQKSAIKQRQISWKIIDPDGDPARSELFYRPLDGQKWISLTDEPISEENYTLNTNEFSDGRYEIKLVASDKKFNDPEFGFRIHETIGPFLIDNTSPEPRQVTLTQDSVEFSAIDSQSQILMTQYRVNDQTWQTLQPEDGIYDEKNETFEFELPDTTQSDDLLEIRILDEGGNLRVIRRNIP